MNRKLNSQFAAALLGTLFSADALANDTPTVDLSFNLLDTALTPTEKDKLATARFSSSMDMKFVSPYLSLKVDYDFQGDMHKNQGETLGALNQSLKTRASSRLFNELLGGNAVISATSTLANSGDSQQFVFNPQFSKQLTNFASLDLHYNYSIAQLVAQDSETISNGYSLGLRGTLADGRINWHSGYNYQDSVQSQADPSSNNQSITSQQLRFNSRIQVFENVNLDLTSTVTDHLQESANATTKSAEQQQIANLSWSPSRRYSLNYNFSRSDHSSIGNYSHHNDVKTESATSMSAQNQQSASFNWLPDSRYTLSFNINRNEHSSFSGPQYYRSANVNWKTDDDVHFSVKYGSQLADGLPALQLTTRFNLDNT